MASDAHCHPYDLAQRYPGAETERRRLGVACAASAWNQAEFLFQEQLAVRSQAEGAAAVLTCFGVHPQLAAAEGYQAADQSLAVLSGLIADRRLAAVGEAGFDLFDAPLRDTESRQDYYFDAQLDLALAARLPLVLHVRRGMHKVFSYSRRLARLQAVIFHSYSGTFREGMDLVKRGVNAYFSFGTPLLLNHKQAQVCCASFPGERLLFETDAPYQPPRGRAYSTWTDLAAVIVGAAALRRAAGSAVAAAAELEALGDDNFRRAYGC